MRNVSLALLAACVVGQAGTALAQSADNSKSNAAPVNSSDQSSIADGQRNRSEERRVGKEC